MVKHLIGKKFVIATNEWSNLPGMRKGDFVLCIEKPDNKHLYYDNEFWFIPLSSPRKMPYVIPLEFIKKYFKDTKFIKRIKSVI